MQRSLARLMAVQALYQYSFYQENLDINLITKQLIENYHLSEEEKAPESYQDLVDKKHLDCLISGIILALPKIDSEIKLFLQNDWKIDSLPDVILPILRLATFELKFLKHIPTKVVISEYVDLAACFYEDKKVTFVNRVLQNIANKNRLIIKP